MLSPASVDEVLFELEERHGELCRELADLEARLRRLRTAANVCPLCGGRGRRWVRGGMYGEHQDRPCPCAEAGGIDLFFQKNFATRSETAIGSSGLTEGN